jgi:hypothetical protein
MDTTELVAALNRIAGHTAWRDATGVLPAHEDEETAAIWKLGESLKGELMTLLKALVDSGLCRMAMKTPDGLVEAALREVMDAHSGPGLWLVCEPFDSDEDDEDGSARPASRGEVACSGRRTS